jgi:chromosome segregation ATPase
MVSDDAMKQLHDKTTRGERLSAEEQAQLQNWYALQDQIEGQTLGLVTDEKPAITLQAQVEAALTQLMTVTNRIQQVAAENDALRREITTLRRQLASSSTLQPA